MAISKTKKEEVVSDLQGLFSGSNIAIFTDFSGMDVATITHLRSQIREAGGRFVVAKKSLINIALRNANMDKVDAKQMEGEVAVAFSEGESTVLAKTIHTFAKEQEKPGIISAIMDGEALAKDEVIVLATLPSRDELLAKLVGSINAPVSGFVQVLNGNISGFVRALNAIADSKK